MVNRNKATARIIVQESQERSEVVAQTQSRSQFTSASGSCLTPFLQERASWPPDHRQRKGREPTQPACPLAVRTWCQS